MERNAQTARPVLDLMKGRCSCRSFTGEPVDRGLLDDLIDTGLQAASGGNLQPYSIIVVREENTKRELRRLGGGQAFVEKADTLLVFALDWSRYMAYTRCKHAPFRANDMLLHFVIGVEDILCAAQTIETAAFLSGLGACYVGGVLETGGEVARLLALPQGAFPIVMLALGHPAPGSLHKAAKLPRELMVFSERCRPLDDEEIFAAYEAKYSGMDRHPLPRSGEAREELLEKIFENLLLTYPEEKALEYRREIEESGTYNEAQRRYGVHYGVETIRRRGADMLRGMAEQDCSPLKLP